MAETLDQRVATLERLVDLQKGEVHALLVWSTFRMADPDAGVDELAERVRRALPADAGPDSTEGHEVALGMLCEGLKHGAAPPLPLPGDRSPVEERGPPQATQAD